LNDTCDNINNDDEAMTKSGGQNPDYQWFSA
jgi:hypothetical protein